MKVLTLKRIAQDDYSTLGVLFDERTPFAVTLERPWLDNRARVSCAPLGEYPMKLGTKPIHGLCWEFIVPNRTAMLIHKGNFVEDSEGCIIIGESFEDVQHHTIPKIVTSVQSSGKAYSEFIIRTKDEVEAKLVIVNKI